MQPNQLNALKHFTFVVLLFYAPIETWASLPGLLSPYYLVDVVGMLLLVLGLLRARTRPLLALTLFGGGWGWLGANGWRATADRFDRLAEGGSLEFGMVELCFVGCSTLLAIGALAWSIAIAARAARQPIEPRRV